jgi:hypothetical protein
VDVLTQPYAPAPEPEPAPPPPPAPAAAGEYRWRVAFTAEPRILRWIAPVCFVLIFLLFFFPWVGAYYGSHVAVRQLGVGVAFGVYNGEKGAESLAAEQRPGVAPFTLLYFLLNLLSVVLAVAVVVLLVAPQLLPPHIVAMAVPWRTLAVAGAALLLLLFLLPQVLFNLPLESKLLDEAEKAYDAEVNKAKDSDRLRAEREYGQVRNAVQRRFWFRTVMLLNLLAALSAVGELWLEKRRDKPLPRLVMEC